MKPPIFHRLTSIKATKRDFRKFGLTIGVVLLIIGLFVIRRSTTGAMILAGAALSLLLITILRPALLRLFFIVWMSLAQLMGTVISHFILALFFYFFLTPLALALRFFGKRFLSIKPDPQLTSYWNKRSSPVISAESLTNQF